MTYIIYKKEILISLIFFSKNLPEKKEYFLCIYKCFNKYSMLLLIEKCPLKGQDRKRWEYENYEHRKSYQI